MSNEVKIRTRAISCFVFKKEEGEMKVLIMKRLGEPLDGEWCQVAGRIEEGEKAWETALRELKEETDLAPQRFYAASICEQFYSHEIDAIMMIPVFVAFVGEAARVTINEEHSEWKWMTLVEAGKALPFSSQREVLERVWADFVDNEPAPLLNIALT